MTKKVYWDANIFLAGLKITEVHHGIVKSQIKSAERGELMIFTSAFTLTELLHLGDYKVDSRDAIRKYFKQNYINIQDVHKMIGFCAQDIFFLESLCHKDSIHLATAMYIKKTHKDLVFQCFDNNILNKRKIEITSNNQALNITIEKPLLIEHQTQPFLSESINGSQKQA